MNLLSLLYSRAWCSNTIFPESMSISLCLDIEPTKFLLGVSSYAKLVSSEAMTNEPRIPLSKGFRQFAETAK